MSVSGKYYRADTYANTAPGAAYAYNNLDYCLAGYIVQLLSGKPFAQYAKDRIFTPLGMSKTSWRYSDIAAFDVAMPYTDAGNPTALGHYLMTIEPAGATCRSTVNDVSKLLRAVMLGGTFGGKTILSAASVRTMTDFSRPSQYGFGMFKKIFGNYTLTGHDGGLDGCLTLMFYNPQTNVGAVVFQNADFTLQDIDQMYAVLTKLISIGER